MKTLIRSVRIHESRGSKTLEMFKNDFKKQKLGESNFKIQVVHHFDFTYIYIKYIIEK